MRLSLRAKLLGIVGVASLAFVAVIVTGAVSAHRTEAQLANIQQRYLPKIETGPQLEAQFDRLRRGLQDAVAARDSEALTATRSQLDELLDRISAARDAIDAPTAEGLRVVLEDYHQTAMDLSRRLIAGETGERLVDAMTVMQAKQARASERLSAAVWFDRQELTSAFVTARQAEITAGRLRLATAMVCLALVILMSFGLGRSVLRSLQALTEGLERFGRGDFTQPIAAKGDDELGDVAAQANQMARSLQGFSEQRDRADWLKGALVGLGQELRGELEPAEVGARAVVFLARYLNLAAAALYHVEADRTLRLAATYAGPTPADEAGAAPRCRVGEGLLGQSALQEEIVVIPEPPPDYLRIRSGLGDGAPRALVFVPLWHLGKVTAVLELASFSAWPARSTEALLALRENLVIAIEVARARSAMRELLAETQRQTVRLREQEEELRATNDALESQQETLRRTNQDLKAQAKELEVQRGVLERSNAELDEAKRRVEQKASELATVSSYKSRFLANMSHELRTPLNSMLLLSSLLAENEGKRLSDKQVEFARTIHGAGQDLLALINQVLDLAKIEAGKHDIRVAPTSMRPLADNLRSIFEPMARAKGLDFVVALGRDAPEQLLTDGQRLEQILKNLIANALKFTEKGRVVLEVAHPTRDAVFTRAGLHGANTIAFAVSDTGVGVAPEDQQRIFAPFEQVQGNVDRRFGGTGLGLSISRELVTLLGGELQLTSTVGRGSTFTCFLPLGGPPASPDAVVAVGAPRVEEAARRTAETPPPPSVPGDERPSLLIIEDDPVFADVVAEAVRQRGFAAVLASDGHTGLRLARERRPAGIVLDVKLPDIDGWRVMELLRGDAATASIPVHFLSALNAPERGLALGAVGFLMKPTTRKDLRRMVEALALKSNGPIRRLLVVEGDPLASDSVSVLLRGETFELHRVEGASEASEALERERFACLILDLSRPDAQGLPVLRALRERHGDHMPPVIVHTSRALSAAEVAEIEAYAGAVVMKDGASGERLLEEVRHFVFRLRAEKDELALMATQRVTIKNPRLDGRKILIVDDDMRTVYALSALLRAKGAVVVVGDTGQAALDVLQNNADVDAVLMDIMMPEMDGYEATRRLRQNPRWATLPVVALTAKAMAGEAETCIAAGATAYLPKPVDADRLLELLVALVPEPGLQSDGPSQEAQT